MKKNLRVAAIAFAAGMLACFGARAQTPGGVAPAVWYKAGSSVYSDAGTTAAANNGTVQQWNDQSGNAYHMVQATSGSRPVYSNTTTLANFNPTLTFDGVNDWMQFTAGTGVNLIDRASGSIYTAGYVNTSKQSGFAGFHASMNYPGLHIFGSNKTLLFFTGGPGYQGVSTSPMGNNSYFTAGSGWQNGVGTNTSYAAATVSLNGTRADYNASQLLNANLSTGARDFRIGADSDTGPFSGQLNEVMVFEEKLTTDQMDRLETYLAVKYGTTYASGTRDYKNSAGSVVWSTSGNAGMQSNIAGIGRDDNGALHQKQSWSTNTGRQVLIGTGTLAGSNVGNATGLANGQFLVWGDNGLAKTPNVAIAGIGGISHRFASIWKVQNTGSVGTVRVAWPKGFLGMKLIQSSDAIIDASDVTTDMAANETVINGVTFNYADVTLSDGQYFTFGAKVPAPGGVVNGMLMWHKADDGVATAGGKSVWQDMSGNGRDVNQNNNAAYQPALVTDATFTANSKNYNFNFNPFYYFDGTNDFFYRLNDGYFPTTTSPGSTYGVLFNSASGGWRTAYGWGDDDPNLVRGDNAYYVTRDNGTPLGADVKLNTANAHIGGMAWKGSGAANNGIYLNVDGRTFTTTSYNIGNINNGNPISFQIGSEGYNLAATGWEVYQGGISEVFSYSTDHQNSGGDEKLRINSYLAIKYGITLKNDAGTAVPNYLSSTSAVVWNATNNTGYNNSIAGLAKDESSELNQKQSRSNVPGQQVVIGTTGLGNTNAANNTALSEGQFLLWGDNGLTKSLSVSHNTSIGSSAINLRFAAVWKVQNTGSAGTVRVAWPSGIVNLHLIQSTDNVINTSDTHTPMSNTTTINGAAYNYADVTLGDGSYFSFGGYIAGPGGVGQDLALWYRADSGVETDTDNKVTGWNNSTANEVKLTMSSATGHIPYNDQSAKTWNFNPTLSFDGTNNFLRNTTTDYLNAAGSVHYITVARMNTLSAAYSSMFAISGNDDGFFLVKTGGQNYPMPAIGNGFLATAAGPGSASRFGIYSAILPKTGTPVNQRGFYNGLEKIYTSPYPRTGGTYVLPTRGAYIGADGTTADNPNGDIAEVIVYHEPAGGDMTNANLARIHSYLAIKYGVTLDQTAPQNYINSDNNIVRNAANNAGYQSNIAGIARDDQGGLYQKQSVSANPGTQVVIGTTALTNTNSANTGTLSNGQFLTWGDNALPKSPKVAITGISGVNYHFASIWKVENINGLGTVRVAWPKGYANLKLIQSGDATIDASDAVTDMGSVQNINGVDYAYADVTLANGQYFTFAAFVQGPGGVTNGLSLWYRADINTEANGEGSDVESWTDFTSGVVAAQLGEEDLPKYKSGDATYFNFNPGVNFTETDQTLGNITVPTVSAQQYDIFTLTKEGLAPGGNGRVFSSLVNNTDLSGSDKYWDGIGIMGDNRIERMNTAYDFRYLNNPGNISWSANSPSIMYNTFTNTTVAKGLNGAANGTTDTHTAIGTLTGGHAIGTTQFLGNGSDNAGFKGHIGELVVYGSGNITALERNKVDSYLAIKYGVTLNNANNYTTSQNAIVWDATTNAGFYNNVAGIGNDFVSALHQKQSRSQHTNANNQVIIGLGDIAATNASNANALQDGQFLIWGDNGNTQAMTNNASNYTAFVYSGSINNARRMNRIWKVQNTGVLADVLVRFPITSVGTTALANDACAGYVMIFASDAAFTTNVTTIPVTVNDTDYEATHSFPNGASYFTFGKVTPVTTGTVYLPTVTEQTTQYSDNCSTGEWTYYHKTTEATANLIALSGYTTAQMNNLAVTITPEGTEFDNGSMQTKLMPRITTVADGNSSPLPTGKVRIYYSQSEMDNTAVAGAVKNGWYKYEGDADAVIADVYADGLLNPAIAIEIVPSATGEEDGVRYAEFDDITSFSSFVYVSTTEASPLPVTLAYFTANKSENKAVLNWTTTNEKNSKLFEIERSADAKSWITIGQVTSAGESASESTYNYDDLSPLSGTNYYRLKMVDMDNTSTYSSIRSVRMDGAAGVVLYPNPVSSRLFFKDVKVETVSKVLVYDNSGRVHLEIKGIPAEGINVSGLPIGIYVVVLKMQDGSVSRHKITVQK